MSNGDAETGVNLLILCLAGIVNRVALAAHFGRINFYLAVHCTANYLSISKKIVKSKKVKKKKTVIYCTYTHTCMHVSCIIVVIYHQGPNILDLLNVLFP